MIVNNESIIYILQHKWDNVNKPMQRGVGVIFLYRCEGSDISVLTENGRNRIAAPTDGDTLKGTR